MVLRLKPHHSNNPAFILGNGRSRLQINASSLLSVGSVYGCNAQYREFSPHFLIAVDAKMINEIVDSKYHEANIVWTNPNKGIKSTLGINLFNPHKGWSSGPTAMWLAATNSHKEIYLLGFDYAGIDGKLNNVYADTNNYRTSNSQATYYGNWLNQTERVIKEFSQIQFFRVINKDSFIPEKLTQGLKNLKHIDFIEFCQKFPEAIYSNQIDQKTTI